MKEKIMKTMNVDLKKVVNRVKSAQVRLQGVLKNNKTWVDDALKYAERQGKEVRKLLTSDVNKVKHFLERERKELEKFQKQIPGEVKKIRKFVDSQKKELEKLLGNVRKVSAAKKGGKKVSKKKKSTGATKKKSSKKASSEASSQS